jgi:hypothetical protein
MKRAASVVRTEEVTHNEKRKDYIKKDTYTPDGYLRLFLAWEYRKIFEPLLFYENIGKQYLVHFEESKLMVQNIKMLKLWCRNICGSMDCSICCSSDLHLGLYSWDPTSRGWYLGPLPYKNLDFL